MRQLPANSATAQERKDSATQFQLRRRIVLLWD
uniref:Uncharacterized protein n=1 Tax=Rhizophora mucronata TaxID=61149 RepID=A0A2P2PM51_RHIMU